MEAFNTLDAHHEPVTDAMLDKLTEATDAFGGYLIELSAPRMLR